MALGDLIAFNIHCVSNKIQFEEVTCYSSCIDLSEYFYVIRRNCVLILLVLTLYDK